MERVSTSAKKEFARAFFGTGELKFGNFKLKSGARSPYYIDGRGLMSRPSLLEATGRVVVESVRSEDIKFDRIAGIPYAGIPMMVAACMVGRYRGLYSRKEIHQQGTGKAIEGEFHEGETVALLDNVITDGKSKLEEIATFYSAGLKVEDVIVLIDREQGGAEAVEKAGAKLHSVFTAAELVIFLRNDELIDKPTFEQVWEYIRGSVDDRERISDQLWKQVRAQQGG